MSHPARRALAALALLAAAAARPAEAQRALGIDTTNFDRAVRPQDDFFRFVNGRWLARTEIPADASSWGAFNELSEASRNALHRILDEAASDRPAATVVSNTPSAARATPGERKKVGDLYASFLDTARIEARGIAPLAPELRRIAALQTAGQLPGTLAHLARVGVGGPLSVGVGTDQKNSRENVLQVSQSGLGLPDRDYYLSSDAKLAATRKAYEAYVARLLSLAGQPDPAGAAARVLALETAIAEKHWDRAKNRDRNATYNRMTVAELAALAPHLDVAAYLKAAGLAKATDVIVRQPDYVKSLDAIVAGTPASTWREYLAFHLVDNYASVLPDAFQQARFDFRGRTLNGQQEPPARWKRAVDGTQGILGEAAGKLYVESYFQPAAKARMDEMVRNLRKAYEIGIDSLEWMSPETKAAAKAKLAKFTVKIAYPDHWRDYSGLDVRRDDAFGNVMRAQAFEYDEMTSRLGKPVDKTRWGMTPQTVNAYYNATNNEIVFPAAILQPPFFDVNADDAVNYGAIGAVIGHEIGHGFDDQGRKSDGDGNLRDWWTSADAQAFEARASKLGAQYEAIYPLEGLHINGRLTMGENIGDLSGLAQAYRAYRISLGGKEPPVIGGFTGEQRFFLGFAQIWRTKFREEALRQRLLSDPHSPGMQRAFVPLVNNDAFLKAFDVKPGDQMWRDPAERVKIW
ncbi:peptidase M13 [Gemmatirosa kalamazoonensis]|uniref:Peptidase M13 n=1 Tax=Gemmatirosa kalamazoonensis TaxID=861299 RepID=W0RGL5_9BACT|nr:M13 family metallopeptidase [Gemmatirosa kalamazoonensis]AHG88548.1 peptidase M13 [Gemmatirosa kalamazoonensis]